jgi:predicted dehydrogenase
VELAASVRRRSGPAPSSSGLGTRPALASSTPRRVLAAGSSLKLDAVLLVTPHTLHNPHAKAALEAGIHVLVE